ncbi:ELWxxDGT repeat protein [Lewinella aquimaris]|uniref:ELWxxDGT repeat protein n=1 Tax=Neolewinella aquimaris TaxID=1835722 RepID=A0A840EI20_9BACT|nr:T9SS type A sorting domain-containing protein [Neolewinella aquimaris]MBB4080546.1 ELWxxDGT repeat protein [Neolewinella aquimaris]
MHPKLFRLPVLASSLFFVLPLIAQQRIQPVINFSTERVNQYSDKVGYTSVIDSVVYFTFAPDNPHSVTGSNGTASGTRRLSTHTAPGGDIRHAFAHGNDYYYFAHHFRDPTQLRRTNYQTGADEQLARFPEFTHNTDYTSYPLNAGRTLLAASTSDSLHFYLFGPDRGFQRLLTRAHGRDGESGSFAGLFSYANDRILLHFKSWRTGSQLMGLDLADPGLDTLLQFPIEAGFTDIDYLDGRFYFSGSFGGELKILVYTQEGQPVDTLNFGDDDYPRFIGPPLSDGRDIFLSIDRRGTRKIYRYLPGTGAREVDTEALGQVTHLTLAPGPLGKRTPYLLVRRGSDTLSVHLLGPTGASAAVVTVVGEYVIYPSIIGNTTQGLLLDIPVSNVHARMYFTDGTSANSGYVRDKNDGPKLTRSGPVTFTGDAVYFPAQQPEEGIELYRMDATGEKLTSLTNIHAGTTNSQAIFALQPFRGGLLFRAAAAGDNAEWWIVGPHDARAKKLVELDNDGENSGVRPLGPGPEGDLLFTISSLPYSGGLFRTAGDRQSTQMIREGVLATSPREPVHFGNLVLFNGVLNHDGIYQRGLFRTDGTTAGTYLLLEGEVYGTVVSGNRVFLARDEEIYVSDGTATGTELVFNLVPGVNSATPTELVPFRGGILFEGIDHERGYGVWFSDGTPEGTRLVSEFRRTDSYLAAFASSGEQAYFMEAHLFRNSIWRTDGTTEGTVRIKTFDGRADFGHNLNAVVFNGRCYFTAETENKGRQIWVTDGTPENTYMLPDRHPEGGSYYVIDFVPFGDYLFYNIGHGLYRTDGTPEGTLRIYPDYVDAISVHEGHLYFTAEAEEGGYELFRTDGTVGGTHLVEDYYPGPTSSYPRGLMSVPSGLFFSATHPLIGTELHRLGECPTEADLGPLPATDCSPVLALPVGAKLGNRTVEVLSSDGPVEVRDYADVIELVADPGTRLTASVSVEEAGVCGTLTKTFTATVPGGGAACLTSSSDPVTAPPVVRLYPNPAATRVRLEVPGVYGDGHWQLISGSGRLVREGRYVAGGTDIRVEDMPGGLYFVVVTTRRGRSVGRLVVR